MHQIFLLPELLGPILSYLPQRDLLLAQRVNRTWNTLITHNKTLQQKLFFEPTRSHFQSTKEFPVTFNPLLQELFPAFYPDDENRKLQDEDEDEDEDEDPCIGTSCPLSQNAPAVLREQAWFVDERTRQAVLRPEASWRRMFPSDPPPRLGCIEMWLGGCCCGGNVISASLSTPFDGTNREQGIRMGMLWDAVFFVVDDNPSGGFSVRWWRDPQVQDEDEKSPTPREGSRTSPDSKYVLELTVEAECSWPCYNCDAQYSPSGLKIVDGEDLVVYREDDAQLLELEATPLSVRRRNPGVDRPYDR
ncbi:uncharacterized protein DSM5745_10336 [Aspergillus mulundensis]|uniref:F-box domain-containing protein n=1 Tax=Aspergillus mulundensis TaxID=1810919 RepID=A0A3D8QN48_9EURO|nr:hypothetical protein DSM5745_10336 [Aspergillus mulundensis]RDW63225.1 hypothetical protein DSM5745_10336 [Aspergillus mulundensis]